MRPRMSEWLTVRQAARDLGIAERTCRKWLEVGRLKGRKDRKGDRDVWRVSAEACRKLRPDVGAAQGSESAAQTAAPHAAAALLDEVRSLREEGTEYRRVIELQAHAIAALAARIADLEASVQKALPPAPDPEARAGWWGRLFRRPPR